MLVLGQLGRAQNITHQMVKLPGSLPVFLCSELQGLRPFVALQLPVGQGRQLFALHQICVHSVTRPISSSHCGRNQERPPKNLTHHRLPDWFSSNGRTRADIASRARKIRDRTVPMGHSIAVAISS